MKFKAKTDEQGNYVWKDGNPVFINTETGKELEVDVGKLFQSNSDLRHEAETNRTERDAAQEALKPFKGIDPAKWKTDSAELEKLRKKEPGEPAKMSDEDLEKLVSERYSASIEEKDTALEATSLKLETSEANLKIANDERSVMYARHEIGKAFDQLKNHNPKTRKEAVNMLLREFSVEGEPGKEVLVKRGVDGKIVPGTDPQLPLTPAERIATLSKSGAEHDYWLLQPSGGPDFKPGDASGQNYDNASIHEVLLSELATS